MKTNWDLLITVILIFTCIVTPFRVAFVSPSESPEFAFEFSDSQTWSIINYTVDICFLIDLICNFFSAYVDDD